VFPLVSFHEFSLKEFHRFLNCILFADIWNFMKITVPGPSMFQISEGSGDFGPYKNYHGFCERLRLVVLKNIDTMAVIFKRYFADALKQMCKVWGKGVRRTSQCSAPRVDMRRLKQVR
jgi:hypothetical protein